MASLTLKNITKRFGQTTALSGIDLQVADGEFCVLLGPSGCGKSTLLNIIAGLIPPTSGTMLLNDEPIDRLSPRERDVAMVFQNYALYPHMTVAENMRFGLRMRKVDRDTIDRRVQETANLLGIEDLLNRKPRELSGGQQQRVAMGRAMVRRPRLFLFDEPLSNLDARLRASVRLELRQLHHEIKGTTIYVTHDQVEAMTLGDKIVVMQAGEIHQIGSPAQIYEQPADTFVATFIGAPEINLYPGKIIRENNTPVFQGSGFSLDLDGCREQIGIGDVELAMRAEDIKTGESEQIRFTAEVEMVSNIGSEQFVHCRLGQDNLTIRAPKEANPKSGEIITLSIDPCRLHIFRNGSRISG